MKRKSLAMAALVILFLASVCLSSLPAQERSGKDLFEKNCSACHSGGGNILNPQKTLHKRDLERNNIRTAQDIVKKMRNPGPFPDHPQDWAGMRMFDERAISDDDALKIAAYILETFK